MEWDRGWDEAGWDGMEWDVMLAATPPAHAEPPKPHSPHQLLVVQRPRGLPAQDVDLALEDGEAHGAHHRLLRAPDALPQELALGAVPEACRQKAGSVGARGRPGCCGTAQGAHTGWTPRLSPARQTLIVYRGRDVFTGLGEMPGHPGSALSDGDPRCVPSPSWPSGSQPGEEAGTGRWRRGSGAILLPAPQGGGERGN